MAWLQHRPALVQARSEVLAGQARRAQGALPYRGFAEFEAALDLLCLDHEFGDLLGANGRAYVERSYNWATVTDSVESAVELATMNFERRKAQLLSAAGIHARRA